MSSGTAVVTGASSGIGAATARRLVQEGFEVVAAARRRDRLDALHEELGDRLRPVTLDVTSAESVAALAEEVGGTLNVLVNNAGGAFGMDPVAEADPADWRAMFEVNVIGPLMVTQALLPALVAGGRGHVVVMGSTAGRIVYEGGGGYTAAKHGAAALTETLRLELNGQPVRVTEIAPGMVATDEFALKRFGGDAERAAKVYRASTHHSLPTTSPTASRGASPGRRTSTSTCWSSSRWPRPPSTRSTAPVSHRCSARR